MSQYWTILQQSAAAVSTALSMPVVIRKEPFASADHGDTFPLVCLSYTTEKIGGLTFNDSWIDYEVNVTLFQDRAGAIADPAAQQWQLDSRETLRLLLFSGRPLPDLLAVFDCVAYDPSPVFDVGGLEKTYSISRQSFVFRNAEARN